MRVHCDSQGYHVYKKIGDPNWINIWGYILRKKKYVIVMDWKFDGKNSKKKHSRIMFLEIF